MASAPPILRLRRSRDEGARIEIVPLIDVIFLVLTFFLYAMVLMVPAKVLPMKLAAVAAGERGEVRPAVTISITAAGEIAVDRAAVQLGELVGRVRSAVEANPGAIVFIAYEEGATIDRLPLFTEIYSRLRNEGLDIRLVGRPGE